MLHQELKQQGLSDEVIVGHLANQFREEWNWIVETLKKGGVALVGVRKKSAVEPLPPEPAPIRSQPREKPKSKKPSLGIKFVVVAEDGSMQYLDRPPRKKKKVSESTRRVQEARRQARERAKKEELSKPVPSYNFGDTQEEQGQDDFSMLGDDKYFYGDSDDDDYFD